MYPLSLTLTLPLFALVSPVPLSGHDPRTLVQNVTYPRIPGLASSQMPSGDNQDEQIQT